MSPTSYQIHLVQQTFKEVAAIAPVAADLFYDRLFVLDPSLRPLFPHDMRAQGHKLMHMLGLAVNGLDDAAQLTPVLAGLGRRHATYGVVDRHYATVGEALIWTLEQGLGEAFTPDVRTAWMAVYAFMAGVMQQAAATTASTTTTTTTNTTTTTEVTA